MRIRACIRHFKCVAEVKQNLDSRVQPVTSYAWSCILRKMALDFEAALTYWLLSGNGGMMEKGGVRK